MHAARRPGAAARAQVTARIPDEGNKLAGGIPTLADVKGLQLNVSLAGDPEVTPAHLLLRDWGRFQSPRGSYQECPYRRRLPPAAPGLAERMPGACEGYNAGAAWHSLWRGAGEGSAMQGHAAAGSPPEGTSALSGAGVGGGNRGVAPGEHDAGGGLSGPGRVLAGAAGLHAGATGRLEVSRKREAMLAGIIDQSIVNWCAVRPSIPMQIKHQHFFQHVHVIEAVSEKEAFVCVSLNLGCCSKV